MSYKLQMLTAKIPQVMLRSKQSIISPAWSPDGKRLAYVSFEANKPVVYVQTLASGQRVPIANFKGNNSAPAWSPNGQQLAIVLSRDSISQIYTINADGSGLRRIMRSPLIDTEPHYTPDGGSLVFTSDRGGSPHIYKRACSRAAMRNELPSTVVTISHRPCRRMQITWCTLHVEMVHSVLQYKTWGTGSEQLLTAGPDDESPSFAPNGMQILYSSVQGGRSVLAVISVDGRVRQTLSALNGKVREPTWGPFTN